MKDISVLFSPIGAIIYATNKIPVTVYRFFKTEEQFKKDVEEAVQRYKESHVN